MKIILLVSTLSGGGAERVASELSLHLPDNVERSFVLLREKIDYPCSGKLRIIKNKPSKGFNIFTRLVSFFRRYSEFKQIVNEEKPDWVIAFSPGLCFLSSLIFKNTVARANNQHSLAKINFLMNLKIRIAYRRAEKVVAISHGVKEV